MIKTSKSPLHAAKIQRHAILVRSKVTALLAFTTTLFLLCVENVKAFTAPLSSNSLLNENTLVFLTAGAHSVNKCWKTTGASTSIRLAASKVSGFVPVPFARAQRKSSTSLKMAFGLGGTAPSSAPPMLDMKTSISAFGGWYNSMDPVARPPVYEDEATDYSFSSPADSWPSSFEDVASFTSMPQSLVSSAPASNLAARKSRRPRPIRTIRKIAGWVFGSPTGRNARGFGTQNFL